MAEESNPGTQEQKAFIQNYIETAQTKASELTSTLTRYRDAATSGGTGSVLDELIEDTGRLKELLDESATAIANEQSTSYKDAAVEKSLRLLSTASSQITKLAARAKESDFSQQNLPQLFENSSNSLGWLIESARGSLQDFRANLGERHDQAKKIAVEQFEHAAQQVKDNPKLQNAYNAVERLREQVQEHEAFTASKEVLNKASTELRGSIDQLHEAPSTEKPVVATLEALKLSRNAINTVSEMVVHSDAAQSISEAVLSRVRTASDKAWQAVNDATQAISHWRDTMTTSASSWVLINASRAESAAVRKAAELDDKYDVVNKAKEALTSVDENYAVRERAEGVYNKAADAAERYKVREYTQYALERAKELDEHYTGGKGAGVVQLATEGWNKGYEYVISLPAKFADEKQGISSSTASTTTSTSTSTQ